MGASTDQEIMPPGKKLPQFFAAVVVNIISFAYGTVVGWSANALPILQSNKSPLSTAINDEESSWIGSLFCLSAFAATPFYSYLSERMGRKLTGYTVAVPFIISWLLMIFANNLTMLYMSRIVVGISSGGLIILCPLYAGEIVEDSIRGAVGTLFSFFINAGILFAFLVGANVEFQTMAIIYLFPPILFLVAFPFMPETPINLLYRDKEIEAKKSLAWLRGRKNVDTELTAMKVFVKSMKGMSSKLTMADLTNRGTVKGIIIGVGLCANQQLCGIFAIITYTVTIFQEAGSNMAPSSATILIGGLQLCASVIAALLMDRAGRKLLLIVSNVAMSICLTIIGTFFYLKANGTNLENFGLVPVLALSSYVVAFGIGLGVVPFVMISEIFSAKVRGVAITLSLSAIWLLAFAVAKLYPSFTEILGIHGCYWLFAGCCVLGAVFAICLVPETKNRSLESILRELNGETFEETDWKSTHDSSTPMTNT